MRRLFVLVLVLFLTVFSKMGYAQTPSAHGTLEWHLMRFDTDWNPIDTDQKALRQLKLQGWGFMVGQNTRAFPSTNHGALSVGWKVGVARLATRGQGRFFWGESFDSDTEPVRLTQVCPAFQWKYHFSSLMSGPYFGTNTSLCFFHFDTKGPDFSSVGYPAMDVVNIFSLWPNVHVGWRIPTGPVSWDVSWVAGTGGYFVPHGAVGVVIPL